MLEKKVNIRGKEYIVREKSMQEFRKLILDWASSAESDKDKPWFERYAMQFCTFMGIEYEVFWSFTPSEIKSLINAWKEVNADFLAIPGWMELIGLGEIVLQTKAVFKNVVSQIAQNIHQMFALVPVQSPEPEAQSQKSNLNTTPTSIEQINQPQPELQPQM
jgi:hypothetical protein